MHQIREVQVQVEWLSSVWDHNDATRCEARSCATATWKQAIKVRLSQKDWTTRAVYANTVVVLVPND